MLSLAKPTDSFHHGRLKKAILAHARAAYAAGESWSMARAARDLGVSSGAPYRHFQRAADVKAAILRQDRRALERQVAKLSSAEAVARATLEFAAGHGRASFRLGLQVVGLEGAALMLVESAARRVAEGQSLEDVWASVGPAVQLVAA